MSDASAKISPIESLKIADFRNFIVARFFLVVAIQMQMTTIGLQVYYEYLQGYKKEEAAFILGLIGLCEAIPFIINSFYSGHVADNFSRKKIILISTFVLFLGTVYLILFCNGTFPALKFFGYWSLFVVVFLLGIVRAFLAASTSAFMSQLVPRNLYTNSTTINSGMWHIAAILGPVFAALIYGFRDGHNAITTYIINALFLLIAFTFFVLIKNKPMPERKKDETVLQSLKVGLSFVFRKKMLLSALSLDLFAVLFGGAVAILPVFNAEILHAGPAAFGLLRTAPAIGAVIMAIFLALRPPAKNAGKLLLFSVIMFGLFTIAFALCTNFWLAFVMLFFTGAFDNISVVIRHTILQLMTPDEMRGRVSAVNGIFIGSSNEIGGFESGLAAKLFGLVPSVIIGGCAVIAVVFGIDQANKDLKKLNLDKI
ncbi:MAG: MFS transporter [Bacteroidia bacterium]|nr:MFS transporter [Bacteroidia bacterium]